MLVMPTHLPVSTEQPVTDDGLRHPLTFRDFVVELVSTHWKENSKPLMLARLGQAAVGSGFRLPEILGNRKLSDYLRQEFDGLVEVVCMQGSTTQFGAKPSGTQNEVLSNASVESHDSVETPKLVRSLWTAFARPIPHGFERRIQLTPYIRFWDLSPPLNEVEGRLPISPDYVAKPASEFSQGRRDDVVLENIRRWMRDNNLDLRSYEEGAHKAPYTRSSSPKVLQLLIDSLDEKDLSRIVMPLDVIAKLLEK